MSKDSFSLFGSSCLHMQMHIGCNQTQSLRRMIACNVLTSNPYAIRSTGTASLLPPINSK